MEIKGIDVSTWQGIIDWPRVAQGETKFAILRATFGVDGVDRTFERNIKAAPAAGIQCGAYHYSYARSVEEAEKEAKHFLEVIAPYQFPYPVAFDLEDPQQMSLGKKTLTDIALRFMQTVQDAGYYVCLYTNLNWIVNYLEQERLSEFDIWLAQWSGKPTYQGNFGLWQYSSEGKIDGISSNVDLDVAYRDYSEVIRAAGLNGFSDNSTQPDPEPDPEPKPDPKPDPTPQPQKYTVQKGDTLSGIAQKYKVSLGDLIRANPQIKNPSVIYPGQIITVPAAPGQQPPPTPKPDPAPNPRKYTVQKGDTLSGIAQKYKVSLSDLIRANPQIKNPSMIYPGDVVFVPVR